MTTTDLDLIVPPGEILREEFLEPMGITASQLAKDIHVPQPAVSQIINGKRSITPRVGLRLARYFGLSESFWIIMQATYDKQVAKVEDSKELACITPVA